MTVDEHMSNEHASSSSTLCVCVCVENKHASLFIIGMEN